MTSVPKMRIEKDSLGTVEVPADALYGAATQRAIENFRISRPLPAELIAAICLIKGAAARANAALGLLDADLARGIADAADAIVAGAHRDQFPIDVYQTGSATSTNMNANEVLATLASRATAKPVDPNDHVNLGQSSNDVIPSAIQLAAARAVSDALLPALDHLALAIDRQSQAIGAVVKTGRTHLMDAVPVTFAQEMSGWSAAVRSGARRVRDTLPDLCALPQGGTAVGTGLNAHPELARRIAADLAARTGLPVVRAENFFERMAGQETSAALSGQLRGLAITLMKISNDLRLMNSGPDAGIGEIELSALAPGSSIMPGKVNPVAAEAVAMIAARVVGNDTTVAIAAQSGNFELNVMLPLIADTLLESIRLLANGARLLADRAIDGFKVNSERIARSLATNPILVTALNPLIGYARAAEIAKRAYAERRPIVDVAAESTDIPRAELERLLDPARLTGK
jgi:fumarate hydratase class II